MTFDQIQRELKAIVDFDALFLAANEYHAEEIDGCECRILRKIELLELAGQIAARN
jgi:hypothetical protein